jgi:hypothetical protein
MKAQRGVEKETFVLKALTHKQLAQMYGVSWFTFQKWIKKVEQEVGRKTGHFYHIQQVKKIFQLFGSPKQIVISTEDVETLFKN